MESEPIYADPRFWVAVAFVGFFVLFGRKLWHALINALDARSAKISAELSEALKLRQEAEEVLISYRKKYDECAKEAADILAHAREEADTMVKQTQAEMKALLEARAKLAEAKIAQAEKQAIDEVREHVADITVATARALIAENLERMSDDAPLRAAIADLERKVH